MADGGKGSAPRPKSVDANTFASNWELAFGKKKKSDEQLASKEESYDLDNQQSNNTTHSG